MISHLSTSASNARSYTRAIIHRNCDGNIAVVWYIVRKGELGEKWHLGESSAERLFLHRVSLAYIPDAKWSVCTFCIPHIFPLHTWREWPVQKIAHRKGIFQTLDATPQPATRPTIRLTFRKSISCNARLLFIFSRCFISSCMLHVYLRVCERSLRDMWRNSWPRKGDTRNFQAAIVRESKVWNYENENIWVTLRVINCVYNPQVLYVKKHS